MVATYFSEKLRTMREHLCLKVKALEHTIRNVGNSDMLRNTDSKGVWTKMWKTGQTVWEQKRHLAIWRDAIKSIEGEFGSGVGSFFRFLRLLLGVNVLSFLLWCVGEVSF